MHNQLPRSTPVLFRYRCVLALAILSLLAGCANGDFKEIRPSLVSDHIHDWIGSAVASGTRVAPRSHLPLTDDERLLRNLAYPLLESPYEHQQWYSVFGEYGFIKSDYKKTFDRTAYADHLLRNHDRSASTRYARLIVDMQNDMTRLPPFFATASRVLDMDRKRRESMPYVSSLSRHERNQALQRNHDNASIVLLVCDKLNQRVASYQYALEQLVIRSPSQQAVEAEQTLNQLRAKIDYYSTHATPTWHREQSLASSG